MSWGALRGTNAVIEMDPQLRDTECRHGGQKVRGDRCAHAEGYRHAEHAGEKLTDCRGRPAAKHALSKLDERQTDDPEDDERRELAPHRRRER